MSVASSLANRSIRCILFDFGSTLWDQKEKAIWKTLEQASLQHALTILRDNVEPSAFPSGDLSEPLRKELIKQRRQMIIQNLSVEPDYALVVGRALPELGFPELSYTLCNSISEALRMRIPTSRNLFDDVLPTLAALKERGFILGVVTNRHHGGPLFLEDLQTLGLLDFFDARHLAISADLGIRKPDPGIFLHALNGLGVAPEEAAMVGDSLYADVQGARALNIFAIWRPDQWIKAGTYKERIQVSSAPGNHMIAGDYFNDDELLEYALKYPRYEKGLQKDITPDLTITNIGDLLHTFIKPGKQ